MELSSASESLTALTLSAFFVMPALGFSVAFRFEGGTLEAGVAAAGVGWGAEATSAEASPTLQTIDHRFHAGDRCGLAARRFALRIVIDRAPERDHAFAGLHSELLGGESGILS